MQEAIAPEPGRNLDRRSLLKLISGLLAAAALPQSTVSGWAEPETLASLIGLRGDQDNWLGDLSADEQRELYRGLTETAGTRPVPPRTLKLLAKVLGRRSRLFAFLDYPRVEDTRSVCDGLMRE